MPVVAATCALFAAERATWAEPTVPLDLQVDLLRKVVRFERGFVGRAGTQITLLLVVRAHNTDSARAAAQLESALSRAHEIAGVPVKVVVHEYVSAAALRRAIVASGAQLVYLTAGLQGEVAAIAGALDGQPTITVSTDGDEVELGAVLGFELVSSHPKIVLNVGQAKRQHLDFDSDLFRLARVIR